ncbi:MAG TPA: helix-turn-helix domain-containing protein [Solirubrobacteraceae bacterium]|nr:helix-turn-helix domain-containing protein [Solirubrobacteraceae bacterium]
MYPSAHIGNIPVEEWLPFLVPIIGLYIYGRRNERRRREAVGRLPDAAEGLDERTIKQIVADLSGAKHDAISPEHLPLLYPPGPDGLSTAELAERTNSDPAAVERLLEDLEEHEYLDLDGESYEDRRVSLTFKGYELVDATELALLDAQQHPTVS